MNKGFTLVELSIVLVIIGLLIGGILVAQSLIDSAKVGDAVRQIQQYDTAVGLFQSRYRQIPGDSSLFAPAGNNDGEATDAVACSYGACIEIDTFWKHLSDSNMINEEYAENGNPAGDQSTPEIFGVDLGINSYGYTPGGNGFFNASGLVYENFTAHHDGINVFSLETKMDDGDVAGGNMRAYDANDLDACAITDEELCVMNTTVMSTNGQPLEHM